MYERYLFLDVDNMSRLSAESVFKKGFYLYVVLAPRRSKVKIKELRMGGATSTQLESQFFAEGIVR